MDYLFRWISLRFLEAESGNLFAMLPADPASQPETDPVQALAEIVQVGDGPPCPNCGSLTVRSGSCHRCMTCGSTSGCS
jgi:ribonucleoside-diphosphate reductase alpha chain